MTNQTDLGSRQQRTSGATLHTKPLTAKICGDQLALMTCGTFSEREQRTAVRNKFRAPSFPQCSKRFRDIETFQLMLLPRSLFSILASVVQYLAGHFLAW
jgi:hypothetical protein